MAHTALDRLDHRPWPCPSHPWVMRQSWCDLLFTHWPISADVLRPLVPPELTIQTFDGTSWLGVVPFRMEGVAPRWIPNVPGLSAFPEINVRLYVEAGGKPGVWFLSLDATQPLAVWAARRFFHLPYFKADITTAQANETIRFRSSRRASRNPAVFEAEYGPSGPVELATPGSLDHWLTERYCLYARDPSGTLWRTDVHHEPWPLQPARASIRHNRMLDAFDGAVDTAVSGAFGNIVTETAPLLHFARRVDVVNWRPERVNEV